MALPHSGSRNDVELVRIETEELTFLIKGKPFHERYLGLKEYQKMDFHDEMDFSVHGDNILEVKVFNIEVEELDYPGLLQPIFFENGIYQVIVVPKVEKKYIFYHEHPVLRDAINPVKLGEQEILMGNLHFQNEIGFSTLEIRSEGEMVLEVTLEIFPVKLDYKKDYQQLLQEVNDEIYNLAYHFIRKTFLHARLRLDGKPSRTEFYRLIIEHFEQFLQAVYIIERQPHHQLRTTYERARGDQLQKQNARTLSYLRKNPQLFVTVEKGIEIGGAQKLPLQGLGINKEITHDSIENRYVKWMMKRLIHKLTDLLETVISDSKRWRQEPDPDLVSKINHMIAQLQGKLRHRFWNNIGELKQSTMSLVIQMAPGYRDVFQIFLIVSKGLMLQGSIYRMSVKDVAILYEYWTFLKLGQILARKYKMISQNVIQINKDGLFVNLLTNKSAERVFRHPVTNEEITLVYQCSHKDLPTTSQIPDTMLQIEKKGKDYTFNYILDAKYRIEYALEGSSYGTRYKLPGPMEEDINTMHRYRDAIVSAYEGPYERTSFGAYVLFPWFDEDMYREHHFYKSIDEVNIGALPFLPNATSLVERVVDRLIDKSPQEIHEEGILPRGTIEEWKSDLEEKVIVGLVGTDKMYEECVQKKCYSIPVRVLKTGWQEAKYVALYLKKDVSSANGVTIYGEIKEISVLEDHVLIFVKHWINLTSVIKPVNYGIANYAMTTYELLIEAKELPELFMKSVDETVLWRMLRRISDKIKVNLNSENLDEASKIDEYKIRDITIRTDRDRNKLIISKGQYTKTLSMSMLEKSPSAVFKDLLEVINL